MSVTKRLPANNRATYRTPRTQLLTYDLPLMMVVAALLLFSLVMIFSASVALPDSPKYATYEPTHFLVRQLSFIGIGLLVGAIVYLRVPINFWKNWAVLVVLGSILLLIMVLIPGIGREVNGARRWIGFFGFNLQPSEFAKLAIIIYSADFISRKQHVLQSVKGLWPLASVMAVVSFLVMKEPDLGAVIVLLGTMLCLLFIGGLRWIYVGGLFMTTGLVVSLAILTTPWRVKRMMAYLDPFAEGNALGQGYQLTHSLIAYGRGEWFGVGLGASIEKLNYLPEAHTDFIMAVVGEELGFLGVVFALGLLFFIVCRAFDIGRQSIALDKVFEGLLAKGLGSWIAIQVFINIGVTTGLLPTKGLTLPFMSYGGSGIIINLCAMAVLLRIDHENRVLMRKGRI